MEPAESRSQHIDLVGPHAVHSAFDVVTMEVLAPSAAASLAATLRAREWRPIDQAADGRARRRVEVQPLPSTEFGALCDGFREAALRVNDVHHRFAVTGYRRIDAPHAVRYVPGRGHYDWHVDAGPAWPTRKLSLVVVLSPPSEYEGGRIELSEVGVVDPLPAGSGVVFPSFLAHRVTPVVSGERISIVCWLHGPTFS